MDAFGFFCAKNAKNLETKKNDAQGKITFDKINYTQDDIGKTYTYTISEVNDNKPGYTYDNTMKEVKVTVSAPDKYKQMEDQEFEITRKRKIKERSKSLKAKKDMLTIYNEIIPKSPQTGITERLNTFALLTGIIAIVISSFVLIKTLIKSKTMM